MNQLLSSKIIGNGASQLFIFHGLFGQSDNWNTIAKRFGEQFTVHLIDLRNHGRSFHSDDSSYVAMVQDINNYLNHHQIDKVNLLGHSLGGRVVMEFAFHYPEKIIKMIVADMAPKAYKPHHKTVMKGLNAVDFSKISKRSDVDDILKQYIQEIGVRQFLLKNVYHKENDQYAFRFNLPVLTLNYLNLVNKDLSGGTFNGDVLFLRGEKSDYILTEDLIIIKQKFPKAVIKTIKNAGHWLQADNPDDFFNEVISFLLKN